MPPLRALLLALALLSAPAAALPAPDDLVDLAGATVVASPGVPPALFPFLPGGRAPAPLAWPLPDGPLLVLGLPETDEAARQVALFWDLLDPGEDLHGGYLVAAWHDGTRPIAVILADDAVALQAARFELESAPARSPASTVDVTKPPEEAGLLVRRGRHVVRARFRVRALFPLPFREESVTDAVAGRANRLWIRGSDPDDEMKVLPRLRRHGIVPAVVTGIGPETSPALTVERLRPWVERGGVRHVVLELPESGVGEEAARRHVERVRDAFHPDEIVLLHASVRVPGTVATWPAPLEPPNEEARGLVTAEDARRARASTSGDLLFVETWAQASGTPVPSRPRGRPEDVARLFDGIVVMGGIFPYGDAEVLEDAWSREPGGREEWEDVLLPLLPRRPMDPVAFLEESAARIEAADRDSHHAVGWMREVALTAKQRVRAVGGSKRVLLVPRVPRTINADGRLDEPAWAHAAVLHLPLAGEAGEPEVTLLACADGRQLHVALRGPPEVDGIRLGIAAFRPSSWGGVPFGGPDRGDAGVEHGVQRGGAWAWRRTADAFTWEGSLDHFVLRGDAYPTRVFEIYDREPREPRLVAVLVLGP